MSKNKSSNNMTLKPCNLFGKRDTIDEAKENAMLDFTDEGKGANVVTVDYGEDILIR